MPAPQMIGHGTLLSTPITFWGQLKHNFNIITTRLYIDDLFSNNHHGILFILYYIILYLLYMLILSSHLRLYLINGHSHSDFPHLTSLFLNRHVTTFLINEGSCSYNNKSQNVAIRIRCCLNLFIMLLARTTV